ncbi:MAG: small multi-drug export protein [Candidatus Hatepunaea meridiana]|nr:small multi-drug export protein [Candidatus Hatepunaea meridiana]
MTEKIAELFTGMPNEAITACLAALPITELRGSIPWATFVLDMTWQQAIMWSILGNLIPVPFILLLLKPAEQYLSRWSIMDRFFQWLFARTRRRGKVVERFKAIGLILFVAIPLPVTGAWTGSVAAHVFGVKFLPALLCLIAGVCIAGTVVTLACQGVIEIGGQFTNL